MRSLAMRSTSAAERERGRLRRRTHRPAPCATGSAMNSTSSALHSDHRAGHEQVAAEEAAPRQRRQREQHQAAPAGSARRRARCRAGRPAARPKPRVERFERPALGADRKAAAERCRRSRRTPPAISRPPWRARPRGSASRRTPSSEAERHGQPATAGRAQAACSSAARRLAEDPRPRPATQLARPAVRSTKAAARRPSAADQQPQPDRRRASSRAAAGAVTASARQRVDFLFPARDQPACARRWRRTSRSRSRSA